MSSRMTGTYALIAPPDAAVLTLDEVKAHLRVDDNDHNITIGAMIDAAVGQIDPAAGGWLGRALRPQTWELRLTSFHDHDRRFPDFPTDAIVLPFPPLIEVVNIVYDDAGGTPRTLLKDVGFRVMGEGARRQAVAPLYGQRWPQSRCDHEAVRIRFTAGYPAPAAAGDGPEVKDTLPAPIKQWLKLQVGGMYENRDSFVVGVRATVAELPAHVLGMLDNLHVVS